MKLFGQLFSGVFQQYAFYEKFPMTEDGHRTQLPPKIFQGNSIPAMENHAGVYKHTNDENFEEFLDKRGANYLAAKMMAKISPTITIEVAEDGTYTIRTNTPVKNFEWVFQLEEEVALPTPDGTKTFIFTVDEDGKLIQKPTGEYAENGVVVEREFTDDGMVQTMLHETSGDTAKRFFERQQ